MKEYDTQFLFEVLQAIENRFHHTLHENGFRKKAVGGKYPSLRTFEKQILYTKDVYSVAIGYAENYPSPRVPEDYPKEVALYVDLGILESERSKKEVATRRLEKIAFDQDYKTNTFSRAPRFQLFTGTSARIGDRHPEMSEIVQQLDKAHSLLLEYAHSFLMNPAYFAQNWRLREVG